MPERALLLLLLSAVLAGPVSAVLAGPALAQDPSFTPQAAEPGCPVCEIWVHYDGVIRRAGQEVGRLRQGVIYFYHSDEPEIIEPLLRFAYERQALVRSIQTRGPHSLGRACGHALREESGITVEISTGARGFFAILTSERPETVTRLWSEAAKVVPEKTPVWF
jgi:hypothetical protein